MNWLTYFRTKRSLLIIVVGIMLTFSIYATYRAKAVRSSEETNFKALHANTPSNDLEAELITILPNGFQPAEIVRPAGRFILVFDNQSRLQPLEFRLEQVGKAQVAEVHIGRKIDSTKVLNLPPGEYRVIEVNHSDWTLKLTLSSR